VFEKTSADETLCSRKKEGTFPFITGGRERGRRVSSVRLGRPSAKDRGKGGKGGWRGRQTYALGLHGKFHETKGGVSRRRKTALSMLKKRGPRVGSEASLGLDLILEKRAVEPARRARRSRRRKTRRRAI